jgi:hypothetical protein
MRKVPDMLTSVFWVVTPCGLADRYQRFEGTYCVHLQDISLLEKELLIF